MDIELCRMCGVTQDTVQKYSNLSQYKRALVAMQELKAATNTNPINPDRIGGYLQHIYPFFFGIRSIQIVNNSPLLLGAYTNLTKVSFAQLNRALTPGSTPLILDPATMPDSSVMARGLAINIEARGQALPLRNEAVSSVQTEYLFTYIHRQGGTSKLEPIMAEMARVLKPKGRLLCFEKHTDGLDIPTQLERWGRNLGLTVIEEDDFGNNFEDLSLTIAKGHDALEALSQISESGDNWDYRAFQNRMMAQGLLREIPGARLVVLEKS